ncbi:GPI-anchor transamidase subunit S [Acrasis kona]|uniref:GPI-anchor transamidase subunit S n=1 Tax=Acrasis kona TaxID=1008807 RepID=A0AAW2ZSL4_9EUKA
MKSLTQSKRFWVAISMAIFIICNAPIWWNTTGAYQTNLPHEKIENAADQYLETGMDISTCSLSLKIRVLLVGFSEETTIYGQNILTISPEKQSAVSNVINNNVAIQQVDDELNSLVGSNARGLYHLIVNNGPVSRLHIGKYRHLWVNLPQDRVQEAVGVVQFAYQTLSLNSIMQQPQVKTALDYRLTFSLLNQDPTTNLIQWDFPSLEKRFLNPILNKLKPLAEFKVDSQVLHYGNLPAKPVYNTNSNRYEINAEDMQYLLNANDFQFDSPAYNGTSLQFLLLLPSRSISPLHILDYKQQGPVQQNAFIVPRWGAVYVYNTVKTLQIAQGQEGKDAATHSSMTKSEDLNIMQVFIEQFRVLIGLPSSTDNEDVTVVPCTLDGVAEWEVDALIRIRTINHLTSALHSLRTLSKLVHQMPNVMVMEDVAELCDKSLANIEKSNVYCERNDYDGVLVYAKQAVSDSEHAFFHPSMLSLLYFPDSQKLAVYLPLVLPVTFTVLMAIVREVKLLRMKKKKNQ